MAESTPEKSSSLGFMALGLFALGALVASAGYFLGNPSVGFAGRWLAIAGLVAFGLKRRSLTAWILVAMAAGAEVGHDWPAVGQNARILSQIFLKLIKTIIAPLLFGTLVVGIAGHTNLRQVGRLGVKALIYFEVVTTLALFIGLAAINLTRAGEGVVRPETLESSGVTAVKQTTADVILHVFPENIA